MNYCIIAFYAPVIVDFLMFLDPKELSFEEWLSKVCAEQPQANFWNTSQKFDLSILKVRYITQSQPL